MVRQFSLLALTILSLAACASEPEKQWYRPGGNYTTADFRRDEADCTKNKRLDEECLRERGWIAISADQDVDTRMQGGPGLAKPGRFAPK